MAKAEPPSEKLEECLQRKLVLHRTVFIGISLPPAHSSFRSLPLIHHFAPSRSFIISLPPAHSSFRSLPLIHHLAPCNTFITTLAPTASRSPPLRNLHNHHRSRRHKIGRHNI